MRELLALTALCLAALACAPADTPPARDAAADAAEIRAGNDAWIAAFQSRNLEALGSVYATDAILYPPGSPPVTGREAIAATFAPMIEGGLGGSTTVEETKVSGEMGYQIGSYTLTDPAGNTVDQGHFVEIWGLEDGRWVLTRDIFNTDLGPAEPAGDEAGEGEA